MVKYLKKCFSDINMNSSGIKVRKSNFSHETAIKKNFLISRKKKRSSFADKNYKLTKFDKNQGKNQ